MPRDASPLAWVAISLALVTFVAACVWSRPPAGVERDEATCTNGGDDDWDDDADCDDADCSAYCSEARDGG